MIDANDEERGEDEIFWRHEARPLDQEEIRTLRRLMKKTDPDKLGDIQDKWEKYEWLWGLIFLTSGWAAAMIAFVWAFKDPIIRGVRAAVGKP